MKNALILLLLVSTAALADDATVLQCRALADAASRLSCYDAMPVGQARACACAGRGIRRRISAAKPAVQAQGRKPQLTAIESTVVGEIAGWRPNMRITLANGQVWRIVDGSASTADAAQPAGANRARPVRRVFPAGGRRTPVAASASARVQ